jgi:hypothetical protein
VGLQRLGNKSCWLPSLRASRSALLAAKAEPKKRGISPPQTTTRGIPQHAEILILNEQAAGIYVLKTPLRNRELRKSVFSPIVL